MKYAALATAVMLAAANAAAAQDVEVTPWLGVALPLTDLGVMHTPIMVSYDQSLEPSVAIGVTGSIHVSGDMTAEAELLYAPADIELRARPPQTPSTRTQDAKMYSAAIGVRVGLSSESRAWQPYVGAGLGLVRIESRFLRFDVESTTDVAAVVRGGTFWDTGPVPLRFEARAHVFRPSLPDEVHWQVHVLLLLGIALRLT